MRTLLQRNDLWPEDAQRYLSRVVERCNHLVAASVPFPSRKVALGVLNCSFNDVVMVARFYLDQVRKYHAMSSYSRLSAAYVKTEATLSAISFTFQTAWVAQFWPPKALQGG